jgi:hypothetical protein
MRHIFQRPSSPSRGRMTRSSKRREHERIGNTVAVGVRTDEAVEEHEDEEVHGTQPSDENASDGQSDGVRTDETVEENEVHETLVSNENASDGESARSELQTAALYQALYQGMKAQTNPNMACEQALALAGVRGDWLGTTGKDTDNLVYFQIQT